MTTTSMPPSEAQLPPDPDQFGPSPTGVGYAVRRHWVLVLFSVLLFVGAGAAIGLARKPTYTAKAKLSVGRLNLVAPGALSGYAAATQALATNYSRAIDADDVVLPVARETGLSAETVRDRLSATPVPESPVFRVEGTAKNRAGAIQLANTGSTALLTYLTELNRSSPDSARLYEEFRDAAKRANAHRATQQRLSKLVRDTARPSSELRAALVRSKTAVDGFALRAQALRQAYTASLAGQSSTELAQVLAPASSASSDRTSKLEILLFGGLVAGLLVGGLLALWRAARRSRAT